MLASPAAGGDTGGVEPRLTEFDQRDALLLAPDDEDTPPAGWQQPDAGGDGNGPAGDREPRKPLPSADDMAAARSLP